MLNNYENVCVKQHQTIVLSLKAIRFQSTNYLPIGNSFIPFDMLIAVLDCFVINRTITVKVLFASLPYSDMGMRYHFRKLVNDGWIELHTSAKDLRVKEILPSQKLLSHFAQFSQLIMPLLNVNANHKIN